ncbi:MAG: hypothetical protein HYZ50_26605 [Deltaproteobacteria bacterium]|nr:hypothetical protein [Deltaproteobacteria bacterium]
MAEKDRDRTFALLAVLFAVLAVSNLLKPFQLFGDQIGFVLFGRRLVGTANTIAGPLCGLYLLLYALGLWWRKRFALPMAHAYATYVVLNLLLFTAYNERPPGVGHLLFGVLYSAIAIGVSCWAAIFITKHKAMLA